MTFAEILKANGVEADAATAIANAMKENKVFLANEENLDIRYGKLKTDHDGVKSQLDQANKLIEDLKKSSKGNEDLQKKIGAYDQQVAELQAQLQAERIDSAIKIGLLSEKALDVDYLTFKLKEKGSIDLDENGKIKGWEDKIAALKTQMPTQFEMSGAKQFQEHKLPDEIQKENGVTKEVFAKMGYQERLKLFNDDPESYSQLNN